MAVCKQHIPPYTHYGIGELKVWLTIEVADRNNLFIGTTKLFWCELRSSATGIAQLARLWHIWRMPHLTIEYSANLQQAVQAGDVLALAHDCMIQSGLFAVPADIKTRAYRAGLFLVGTDPAASFAHATVHLLAGRTVEQKQALTQALLAVLRAALPSANQLSVDIRDMERETYRKYAQV
jgi:5-carboxymethyl-2-hydroxymuconate isomerase